MGGTTMAQPEIAAELVEARPEQRFIVVSAPGIDSENDVKVTDMLESYAVVAKADDVPARNAARDEIIDRFDSIYNVLGSKDRKELRLQASSLMIPAHHDDAIYYMHLGEALSARYFARLLGANCLAPAIEFHGNGRIDRPKTMKSIQKQMMGVDERTIIPGFFGRDKFNRVWLLGRGGSDRTGALYAAALGLDYENWTDVDGVYSADPRVVSDARILSELTREEVREGAHGGTGVLMGDTLVDLNGSSVVTTVKNTFNPEAPGTRIVRERDTEGESAVVAVSGRTDLKEISIRDMGMADEPGYVSILLKEFGRLGLSFQHMPTAQDSFSITTLAPETKSDVVAKHAAAVDEFADFVRHNSHSATVEVSKKGVVYAVGERLRDPEVRGLATIRILGDFGCAGHGVEDVVSNRLSPSLAFLVQPDAVNPMIDAIHAREITHTKTMFR